MKRTLLCLLSLVPLFLFTSQLRAQRQQDNFGTEFYVAFGPNEGGEDYATRNNMSLYVTSRVTAHGKVEIPALGFYRTFISQPNTITTIPLPNGNKNGPTVEITTNEQIVHGMAVHITSDSEIAVFGMNHKLYSSDAFMALPIDVLGTEYRTINYQTSNYLNDHTNPGEFWVVAPEDSTNVTITLRDNSSQGTAAKTAINVRLNRGDVYLIQGSSDLSNDLTGSHVESDHPIAVFSGHMRTQIPSDAVAGDGRPSRDHLVEQLPPVSAWGDSALVVPFASSPAPDLVRIVAAEDGTDVTVNGSSIGRKLNAGDFYEITRLNGVTSIQASNPIMVGQYSHTSVGSLGDPSDPPYGDPALALVFPVEQFTTSYTIVSIVDPSSFTGNFVNIVAEADAVSSMTLDGTPIDPKEFHPIPGSRYVYSQHELEQGTHVLKSDKPFGVTIYGLGPVDSYAYTGGTLLKTITPLKTLALVIDFGDRVLDASLNGKFDTVVPLQNVSQDPVNIYSFPRRIQDTSKFHVIDPVPPYALAPGASGQMTIEFEPREVNRRMHTQITAKTDHLRAYVVDVYGRGVKDEMGIFREEQKLNPIDTIDFGIFANGDPVADTDIYIGNAGLTALQVTAATLGGTNAADFQYGPWTLAGAALNIPFTIREAPSSPVKLHLQFTPTGANGPRLAQLVVTSTSGQSHTVVLRARIETLVPSSIPLANIRFDSTLVCEEGSFSIPVTNPNDLPVTITDASIIGTDAGEFVIASSLPMKIPAGQTVNVEVHFAPSGKGLKTAQAVLQFDLPKNAKPDTVALSGVAGKRLIEFFASQDVLVYSSDQFMLPIYAKTDLTPFGAIGYTIHVFYDSVNLKLIDVYTNNTLTPRGYVSLFSGRGRDTVLFFPQNDQPLTGGGPTVTKPLVNLKFEPRLNGADPQTFTKSMNIRYTVDLGSSSIAPTCIDNLAAPGQVQVLSVCSPAHLIPQGAAPQVMMLEQSYPNPFNPTSTVNYDISQESPVKVDVLNAAGEVVRVLVDEVKEPGYYSASLDGSNLPSGAYFVRMTAGDYLRIRKVMLSK